MTLRGMPPSVERKLTWDTELLVSKLPSPLKLTVVAVPVVVAAAALGDLSVLVSVMESPYRGR